MIKLNKKGIFSLTIEMMKWAVIYPIVITVIAVFILAILQMHISRDVQSEDIELVLAKDNFAAKFSNDGVISDDGFDGLAEYSEDDFAVQVVVAGKEHYSNFNLYRDNPLCSITNSPNKCSRTVTDF